MTSMAEYISREAAMKSVTALNLERNLDSVYDEVSYRYHRAAERAISTVPAADVRPVVRGKWITRHEWDWFVCSNCSYESNKATNFCPNCGADMREVDA